MSRSPGYKTGLGKSGLRGRVLVINPPVEVPAEFIDYPPTAFLAPYIYTDLMRKAGVEAEFLDCFVEGDIKEVKGGVVLGAGAEDAIAAAVGKDRAVIHYSPFHRHKGLHSPAIAGAVKAAQRAGLKASLADFYDGSCHYIDYAASEARRVYPGVDSIFRLDRVPFLDTGLQDLFGKWSLGFFGGMERHVEFLGRCSRLSLVKDVFGGGRLFPYLASTGCPHHCLFCTNSMNRWVPIPTETVESDWRMLAAAGVGKVVILDQFANMDVGRFKRLLGLASALKLRLHFANGLGLGRIDEETADMLRTVVDALYVSPESGDEATARHLGKPFSTARADGVLRMLRSRGIDVHAHFIVGAPGEGRAAANRSLARISAWAEELGVKPHVQPFVPKSAFRAGAAKKESIYRRFSRFSDPWIAGAVENLEFRRGISDASKLIINVSYACSNNCAFCSVADRKRADGGFSEQARALGEFASRGVTLLDVDGGEPLLYPGLFDLLDLAECLGYNRITLTTNGRLLSDRRILAGLGRRSMDILVSLHGSRAETHDLMTRSAGSFDETVRGVRAAIGAGMNPGINVTLTRKNEADLPAVVRLAGRLGARVLNIQWYTPFGVVDPSLEPGRSAGDRVRETVRSAVRAGLDVNLVNFPYCVAPDLADRMRGDFFKEARHMLFCDGRLVNLAEYLGGRRFRTARCGTCSYAIICRGFWDYGRKVD